MKKVSVACPVCNHIFSVDVDSKEDIVCPKCGTQLSLFPPEEQEQQFLLEDFSITHEETIHPEDSVIKTGELLNEVANLDDEALYDEIVDYLRMHPFMRGVELIELEMETMGKFRPSVRKQAEGIYVLINNDKKVICPIC